MKFKVTACAGLFSKVKHVMNIEDAEEQIRGVMDWLDSLADDPLEHAKAAQALSVIIESVRSEVSDARSMAVVSLEHMGDTELAKILGVHRSAIYKLRRKDPSSRTSVKAEQRKATA